MAKKKNTPIELPFVVVEYNDGIVSAAHCFDINETDERVTIVECFDDLEEAKIYAQEHAKLNDLNYKF